MKRFIRIYKANDNVKKHYIRLRKYYNKYFIKSSLATTLNNKRVIIPLLNFYFFGYVISITRGKFKYKV